jgi:hypothetical protein
MKLLWCVWNRWNCLRGQRAISRWRCSARVAPTAKVLAVLKTSAVCCLPPSTDYVFDIDPENNPFETIPIGSLHWHFSWHSGFLHRRRSVKPGYAVTAKSGDCITGHPPLAKARILCSRLLSPSFPISAYVYFRNRITTILSVFLLFGNIISLYYR